METYQRNTHYAEETAIDHTAIRSSFWMDEGKNHIHSVIVVKTGDAHIQISASPDQLRTIALQLNSVAARIAAFAKQEGASHDQ